MKPNRESQKREQMWRPVFSGSILVRSSSRWWTVLISRWQRHLRPASLWSSRWSVHDRANHTVLYHFKTWETGDRITLEEGFRRQVSTDGFWSPQLKVVVTQPRRQLYLDWRQALRSFPIVSSHFDHRLFCNFCYWFLHLRDMKFLPKTLCGRELLFTWRLVFMRLYAR